MTRFDGPIAIDPFVSPPYCFSPLSFACSAPISTVRYFYPTATLLPRHPKQFKPKFAGFLKCFMFDTGVLKGFPLYHEEMLRAGNDDSHALVSVKRSRPRGSIPCFVSTL